MPSAQLQPATAGHARLVLSKTVPFLHKPVYMSEWPVKVQPHRIELHLRVPFAFVECTKSISLTTSSLRQRTVFPGCPIKVVITRYTGKLPPPFSQHMTFNEPNVNREVCLLTDTKLFRHYLKKQRDLRQLSSQK